MQSRWSDDLDGLDQGEQLVKMSRLIGSEPGLVLWGGGNTSAKGAETDFLGSRVEVLRVKGSGSDLRTVESRHFTGVRLEPVRRLLARETMDDDTMVDYLAHCLMEPGGARPSIETLLHAFLPHRWVIHSHADAILAILDATASAQRVQDLYQARLGLVAFIRPGFAMAKEAASAASALPGAEGLLLMNHGLVTWGETAREAYTRHIEAVTRAEDATAAFVSRRAATARTKADPAAARTILPALRGALSDGNAPRVLLLDDSEDALAFANRPDLASVSQRGVATPDHILHTLRVPLLLEVPEPVSDAAARDAARQAVARYKEAYGQYVDRHNRGRFSPLDGTPRVAVLPGIGIVASGSTVATARVPLDIYRHTTEVIWRAETVGGYLPIDEAQAFEVEYWPLELYKLTLRPRPRPMGGRVACVTGGGAGIGRACALHLARQGAAVAVMDTDLDRAQATAEMIAAEQGQGTALAVQADVGDPDMVRTAFERLVRAFGGLDILVSNAGIAPTGRILDLDLGTWERSFRVNVTGHFLVAREAVRIMRLQETGGSAVFVVTKNALVPGSGFGAYSAAKAAQAQLARILAIEHGGDGIRVNMVNPDAVWTDLWTEGMRRQRAQAYGVAVDELEAHYRDRTLLKQTVTVDDVAKAVVALAGDTFARTTGSIVPVDGGVREGFPR